MKANIDEILKNMIANYSILEEEKKRKENNVREGTKESEEKAKKPDIIADEFIGTSEEIHGGEEKAGEVKEGKSGAKKEESKSKNGEGAEKDNKGEESRKGKSRPSGEKEGSSGVGSSSLDESKKGFENGMEHGKHRSNAPKSVKEMFDGIKRIPEDPEKKLDTYINNLILELALKSKGKSKEKGSGKYDVDAIAKHFLTGEDYKILSDKTTKKPAKKVTFFLDTSGVEGAGILVAIQSIRNVIPKLVSQGFECEVADCGNGFSVEDKMDDEYNAREKMESIQSAKLAEVVRPCPSTAARLANQSEFSIVVADFDGLSSISQMASMCRSDKVPYFLCTEERYSWEDPTMHSWVDEEWCTYPEDRVYDLNDYIQEIYEKNQYDKENREEYIQGF